MTITSEIWQMGGDGFTAAQDAAIYLICFDGSAAIVDAGCGGQIDRLEANVRACGVKPELVECLLITHCHFDHIGGAEDVRTRFDCPIVAHEKDAVAMETGISLLTAANWYGRTQRPLAVDIKFFRQSRSDHPGYPLKICNHQLLTGRFEQLSMLLRRSCFTKRG